MLTDHDESKSYALFLFCHQDDEYGVYQQILTERARGRRVICAYLTSGVAAHGDPAKRNAESLAVLQDLGVETADVCFAGSQLGIVDGHLLEELASAADWLQERITSFEGDAEIYVPAWEGGHPDHDALHFLCVRVCSELGLLPKVRQFPLYNAQGCSGKFFRVLSPLEQNGAIESCTIPWSSRLRFMRYALGYPSQWRSWLGLFPFFVLHLLLRGSQDLQCVDPARVLQPPPRRQAVLRAEEVLFLVLSAGADTGLAGQSPGVMHIRVR